MLRGYQCKKCGWMGEKGKKRTIKKTQYDTCPDCSSVVTPWEKPLHERPGRCGGCAGGSFTLAIISGALIRTCKQCGEKVNTDKGAI